MDTTGLLAALAREFEVTGAATPSWPNPHADMAEPREEEYSRCLDPGKYRIVAARAEAWARALVATRLADREPIADPATVWDFATLGEHVRHAPAEHGDWLRPHAAGALPLLLTLRSAGAPDNHLDIGAADPAVRVLSEPDCGCDACDSGSDDLLRTIDDCVLDVVSGALVHVVLPDGTTVIGRRDGWSASRSGPRVASRETVIGAVADVRAGRWHGAAVHGAPWW